MTTVRIYQPCRSAMQSGKGKTKGWVLEFETRDPLKPDPIMGWTSSKDMRAELHLPFQSLEDALCYAKANGFSYTIYNSTHNSVSPQSYGTNFTCARVRGERFIHKKLKTHLSTREGP